MSTLQGRPAASRQVLRVGALTTLSRNFQLEFLRPLVGRSDVELIVRSGTMRERRSKPTKSMWSSPTAPRVEMHARLYAITC
jgi:hypothetical protein